MSGFESPIPQREMTEQRTARPIQIEAHHRIAFEANFDGGVLYAIGIYEGVSVTAREPNRDLGVCADFFRDGGIGYNSGFAHRKFLPFSERIIECVAADSNLDTAKS